MEIQKMIKYIDEPLKMKEEALQDIKALLEKYPFFHTANLLLVKAAHNIQDDLYNSEINKVSASIPNREILHELINLKEIQIVVEEKKEKPKESKTRTDIRKRIKERKLKRTSKKEPELLTSGKARHQSLIKDFFEPVLEKLVKNIENFRVIIKNDILPETKDNEIEELTVEEKRARKKAEREKRMAEKRRLKAEESQGNDREKRKAEREKRKAEREKRIAARIAGEKTETPTEENVAITKEPILDDREKRKLERQKRKEDKEKQIAKQIAEEQNKDKTEETSTDKKTDNEDIKIVVETAPTDDREKRKLERQKRKEEKEKQIAKQIAEKRNKDKTEEASTDKKTDNEDIKIVVETAPTDDREKRKLERQKRKEEKEKQIAKQIAEKQNKTSEKIDINDPYTKIISIPSSGNKKEKEKEQIKGKQKETKEVITNKVKETQENKKVEEVVKNDDEIEDIFSKILNSKRKKPLSKERNKETKNTVEDKVDEIEFIVEDKTEKNEITKDESIKKAEDVIIDENEEVFELIEKKEDELKPNDKKEEQKPKTEVKVETKAANSVFDKIAAYKSKKGASSKINKEKNEHTKKEEAVLKTKKNEKDTPLEKAKPEASSENAKKAETKIAETKHVKKEVDIELSDDDNNLIDKFVLGKPTMKRPVIEEEKEIVDISKESTKVKKPVITELMASIYVNQAKYNQAIEIYEQLILKNPEKKDYFASKIKETENLK